MRGKKVIVALLGVLLSGALLFGCAKGGTSDSVSESVASSDTGTSDTGVSDSGSGDTGTSDSENGGTSDPESGDTGSSEEKTRYTVTATYDETKGSVLLSPVSEDGYAEGSTVLARVTPAAGYSVAAVRINGAAQTLAENNTYRITVSGDMTVEADFIESALPVSVLSALQGKIRFDGGYHADYAGDEVDLDRLVSTLFTPEAVVQKETDKTTGEVFFDQALFNSDGKVAFVTRTLDNKVTLKVSSYDFAEYGNPFVLLTREDFVYAGEGVYSLTDGDKRRAAASALSGWNESIAEFLVFVEDGAPVKISFTTENVVIDDGTVSYVSSYTFSVVDVGTAEPDPSLTLPYERAAEHDALETALGAMAGNYTIDHLDRAEGEEDVRYNVYVTDDAIYNAHPDERRGYVQLTNGYVYPFTYDATADKITLEDRVGGYDSIADAKADFTAFDVALFRFVGNGTYVLRDPSLAGAALSWIGEGPDEQGYYSYATSMKIVLKEDVLYQIVFDYTVYGFTSQITLTYGAIGTTVLDFDFASADKTSVLDPFVGAYKDGQGNFAVVDVEDGVWINGERFTVSAYDKENGYFTGEWKGEQFYLSKLSMKQLYFWRENESGESAESYTLTLVDDSVTEIPADLHGVWTGTENAETGEIGHRLIVQTYVLTLDGVELDVLSYDWNDGLVAEKDGVTYVFSLSADSLAVMTIEGDVLTGYYSLGKAQESAGIEIPAEYVGVYESADKSLKVVITYSSITVNGVVFTPTEYDDYYGFTGTLGEITDYMIGQYYTADKLQVGTMKENYIVDRVATIKSDYVGLWTSVVAESGYTAEITETGITVNGKTFTILRYDSEYGYVGELGEKTTYLKYTISRVDGSDLLVLYDEEISVLLCRAESFKPDFIGVWRTEYGEITVVVTATEVMVNGVKLENLVYDETSGFIGKLGNVENYFVRPGSVAGTLEVGSGEDADAVSRASEISGLTVDAGYVGVWKSKDGVWTLEAAADGFTINGLKASVVLEAGAYGYDVIYGGISYSIQLYSGTDGDYLKLIALSDYSNADLYPASPAPAPGTTIPEKFYGVYEGTTTENVKYVLTIAADGIALKIGDAEAIAVTVTAYDDYEGFTVTFGGATYYITQADYEETINKVAIMSEDYSFRLTLTRRSA